MRSVRRQVLPGLVGAAAVLVALALTVGLGAAGWALGAGCDLAILIFYGLAARRHDTRDRDSRDRDPRDRDPRDRDPRDRGAGQEPSRSRPADQVTMLRAALVGGVAALVADALVPAAAYPSSHLVALVTMSAVALALDGVDGWLARRTRTVSALGARFDMEIDALLILLLSGYVARSLGGWVLLIGLARYALLAACDVWPWLRGPTPPRYWAKVVAAIQGIVLTVVASALLPRPIDILLTLAALILLAESFGHQVRWLVRARADQSRPAPSRARLLAGRAVTVAAVALLWVGLAWPDRLERLTPGTFGTIPIEGLVLVAVALFLPSRPRQILAGLAGGLLGVLVLLKALDMGYYEELDRAFNPVVEWSTLGPAIGVLRDSVGPVRAYAEVAGAALLAVGLVAVLAWAAVRVARVSAAHRPHSATLIGALALVWVAGTIGNIDLTPNTPVASGSTSSFAATEVRNIAAAAHDRQLFPEQLVASDSYRFTPPASVLAGLRGKDVIFAFVESYGQTAVQGSTFAPGVDTVLAAGTTALDRAGFSSRSAFLTSPTFGGISWLAHSTLQSGLWIDNQQRYDQLVKSSRYTLSDAFKSAGWRTVADDPSDQGSWPEGSSFYHYDQVYNAKNTGYHGPSFSYATMPDEFSLQAFQHYELTPSHAPVMAEIDLVSSHYPWTPLPKIVPWNAVGDGSIYDPMPAEGPTVAELYKNYDDVRASYGRSIQYSIESLISFVQNAHDNNLVLVMLGDHQPAPKVSGPAATHAVPISIIAHDPAVLDQISSWGWTPGLRPAAQGPTWPMDAFRNQFLDAFRGQSSLVTAADRP